MTALKWFAGGTDRAAQAIKIIDDLRHELNGAAENTVVQNALLKYRRELVAKESSVPFVLSRMNLEVSNAMIKSGLTLSADQSRKLKQLTALANIRYGY